MLFVKIFEEEVNVVTRGPLERQPTKKKTKCCKKCNILFFFFSIKDPFKKDDEQQKYFLQDLGLLIVKNQQPL
jgi:hypothetical protein